MALHMLQGKIPHRIPIENLEPEEIDKTSQVEQALKTEWNNNDRRYKRSNRQSWLRYFISMLLTTGWHAVAYLVSESGCIAEVWNPAEVFPEFDVEHGLVKVVKSYSIDNAALRGMAVAKGWSTGSIPVTA